MSSVCHKKLIVITGPTASGKTSMAIALARWLGTEIVSADSRQVYKEMSIGTAKPTAEQLAEVKHHLVGHVSITENYNAGRYEKDALECLDRLFLRYDKVILAGGTGLYINALCHGLDELPESDLGIRQRLEDQLNNEGIVALQDALLQADPAYYQTVDLSNPVRLMRALEVCEISGKPYSSFRKGKRVNRDFNILKIGLEVPREELINRINNRIDEMIRAGLLEEVISLLPYRRQNALNTVGYSELFDHLDGKTTLEDAIAKVKINTRRYAKRQMTWFRRDPEIVWLKPEFDLIRSYIEQYW